MNMKRIFLLVTVLATLSGCSVMKDLGGAYNMTQCKYDYKSITNLSLAGTDLSKGITLAAAPKLLALFSGTASNVPMNFTLNLNVNNPNQTAAALQGLQYILSIDNVQFTTGSVTQALNIPSGGTQVLPLSIGFDLATLLKGDTKDAVAAIAKNFIGIGDKPSSVTLQLKPTFAVGGYPVTSPVYIPVNFSFGGAK